jgi:hypothetical protein
VVLEQGQQVLVRVQGQGLAAEQAQVLELVQAEAEELESELALEESLEQEQE